MVHYDVKYGEGDGTWLIISHGDFSQKIVARRSKKKDAVNKARGILTQRLAKHDFLGGTGEVHIYSKNGELKDIEEVEYNAS